jgi:hypothetical protein
MTLTKHNLSVLGGTKKQTLKIKQLKKRGSL